MTIRRPAYVGPGPVVTEVSPKSGTVQRPNERAKLPGPPGKTLPSGKPKWRPRSASAGWARHLQTPEGRSGPPPSGWNEGPLLLGGPDFKAEPGENPQRRDPSPACLQPRLRLLLG